MRAEPDYQNKLARFMENHDEPRSRGDLCARDSRGGSRHHVPVAGLRFFHQGQLEGRRKRISPHLVRAPMEPVDGTLRQFYDGLLATLRQPVVRDGQWRLLQCTPAWDGNGTSDGFLAWSWRLRMASGG